MFFYKGSHTFWWHSQISVSIGKHSLLTPLTRYYSLITIKMLMHMDLWKLLSAWHNTQSYNNIRHHLNHNICRLNEFLPLLPLQSTSPICDSFPTEICLKSYCLLTNSLSLLSFDWKLYYIDDLHEQLCYT